MHTPFPITEETTNEGFIVPECCRKGLKTCPHRAKQERAKPANIGL